MKKWVALIPLAVVVLLAALFAGYGLKRDPQVVPDTLVGRQAPAVTLPDLATGAPTPIRAGIEGPVFVNFFASWCGPCIVEAPALMAMKSQGVKIVGVAYKDAPADTRAFLAEHGNPFATVLVDRDGRQAIEFGVSGAPETFLIDAKGKVIAKHSSVMTPEKAEEMLEQAGL
jgi:cytochrome c biogenesis protein CcmG/thiol:disulfide interchange protein DsbE